MSKSLKTKILLLVTASITLTVFLSVLVNLVITIYFISSLSSYVDWAINVNPGASKETISMLHGLPEYKFSSGEKTVIPLYPESDKWTVEYEAWAYRVDVSYYIVFFDAEGKVSHVVIVST